MDCKEGIPIHIAPFFDGTNSASWSIRMKIYLHALGFGIWESLIQGPISVIEQGGQEAMNNFYI
jgi:hypothetical protein